MHYPVEKKYTIHIAISNSANQFPDASCVEFIIVTSCLTSVPSQPGYLVDIALLNLIPQKFPLLVLFHVYASCTPIILVNVNFTIFFILLD